MSVLIQKRFLSRLTTEERSFIVNLENFPEGAYRVATNIIERHPEMLSDVILWRWEMELARGTINFDPRNPQSYKAMDIGHYVKRIIPDRIQPETEKFSDPYVPVFLPFEKKYPNNFDFTMAKRGQRLLNITIDNNILDVYASNSPLASVPHTLLVPSEPRSHFLLPADMRAVSILRERYPQFHFIYSSMGAGAGVNHQHWHMMAGECDYPVLRRSITFIEQGKNVSIGYYPQWPTDCFVIENHSDYKMDIETEFVQLLQQRNIPHNLFVKGGRTWINPRSHVTSTLIPDKKYGAWETVLGICNTGSQEQYDFVNESILEEALREIQLNVAIRKQLMVELENIVKKYFDI